MEVIIVEYVVEKDGKYFYINDNYGSFTEDINKAKLFTKSVAKRIAIQIDGTYRKNKTK